MSSEEPRQHHSVDLGGMGSTGQATHCQYRRFSVDLGEVREFIALREMRMSSKDECPALACQPDAQETSRNAITC